MSDSCDPMNCRPPGSSVHGILQARILEVGCHLLLQGIFLIQGLNSLLLHCRLPGKPKTFFNATLIRRIRIRVFIVLSTPAPAMSTVLIFTYLTHRLRCSIAKLYPTLCGPMDCSTPGSLVLHYFLEFAQTYVH